MNNILTYSEYRRQVRLYEEQLVAMQIMKPVEEGLFSGIRKKINAKASIFVREALAEEIEMGKQLNEAIQEAVKELKEYIDKVQEAVDDSNPEKTELMKKLEKIFEDIRKASFELLEILSGVEINFSDYVANATMAVFVNFGMLFIPTRSVFLLKKSYKYFIGLIKNTIRRDMLMLMLNFDQFENTVLIQSLEDDEQTKWNDEMKTKVAAYEELASKLIADRTSKKKGVDEKEAKRIKDAVDALRKGVEVQFKLRDRGASSIGFDAKYDNTYTKTLDQLKNFVLEDDAKYLEAIKNGMRSLALDEIDTKTFVELLISAAEECAYEVSAAIHTNFIDKVSVFKLANQKRLIEIVKKDRAAAEAAAEEERKKAEKELKEKEDEDWKSVVEGHGEEIFDKVVYTDGKGSPERKGEYQFKEFESLDKEREIDGKKYDEKKLLVSWLGIDDNWEKNKEHISPELRLLISNINNEDSYESYLDFITETLPVFIYIEKEKGAEKFHIKRTASGAYDISLEKDEKIKNCHITTYKVSDERVEELRKIIVDGEKSDIKESDGSYKISEDKEEILKKALDLISENVSKLKTGEKKIIISTIKRLCKLTTLSIDGEDKKTYGFEIKKEELDIFIKIINSLSTEKIPEKETSEKETSE